MGETATFIDGPSLRYMGRALGLRGGVSYPALYDLLKKLGTESGFRSPVITVHPEREELVGKILRNTGFEVIAVSSEGQRDDAMLKARIRALGPDVAQIIMVSSDSDFVPELREKVRQGLKVTWVATMSREDGRDTTALGELVQYCIAQGEFSFVELGDYQRELVFERSPGRDLRGMRIVIQTRDINQLPHFISDIAPILEKYAENIEVSIEGPGDQ